MKQTINRMMDGIGHFLICLGFIGYLCIAMMDVEDVARMALCAVAMMACGAFLTWWRV